MNKGNIRRKLSIFCMLAVFLTAFVSASIAAYFLVQPTALADAAPTPPTNEATWFYSPGKCQQGGAQALAALAYTDSLGKTVVLTCSFITQRSGATPLNYMQLQGPSACNGNPGPTMIVGQDANSPITALPLATSRQGTLTIFAQLSPNGICQTGDVTTTVTLTNNYSEGSKKPQGGNAVWTAENPGQLTAGTITVNGYSEKGEVFTQSSIAGNVMTLTGTKNADTSNCSGSSNLDTITVGDNNTSYMDATTGTAIVYQYQYNGSALGCTANSDTISLNDSYSHVCSANGVDCSNSGGTSNGSSDSCAPGSQLAWILCPVSALLDNAVTALNGVIGTLLYIPTSEIWPPSPQVSPFQHSFDAFRNAAIALLVIAGLVMVISQASDLEVFSAHTVRKALPRIVVAAIGIALAWPLLQLTVTFFNDMGDWIGRIILFSVGDYTPSLGSVVGEITGVIGGAALALIGVGYMIFALGLGGSGLLVLSILLVFLIGFLVLALRQVVVILCVMLAPLAIASYVLPGTEKLWKFWKDTLLTTLMMYPIIIAFLAAGAAMAHVALSVSGNPFMGILALLLYITPYVMIPFAFKLAGGLMASAISMVEGTHRKSIEGRLGKKRQEIAAGNWNDFKAGNRFAANRKGGLGERFNTLGGGFGAFLNTKDKRRFLTDKGVRQSAFDRHNTMVAADYAKQAGTAATQFNDDMLRAQTWRSASEAEAGLRDMGWNQTRIDTAMAAARAQGGFGVARQTYATQQLAATGTGYENMNDMLSTVARVSGGNRNISASMIGNMRSSSERAGRNDLKAGYVEMEEVAANMADPTTTKPENAGVPMSQRVEDLVTDAARGIDNATLMRNKTKSVGNASTALVNSLQRNLDNAGNATLSADQRQKASEMAGALRAKIENMVAAGTFGYGPELNVEKLQSILHQPTPQYTTPAPGAPSPVSLDVRVQNAINPSGGQVSIPSATPGGRPTVVNIPNPNYNPDMARIANEQAQRTRFDPNNDPRNQP